MLQQQAYELVQRWISKGDKCKTNKIDEAFDRYFSFFVAYNSIYFIALSQARLKQANIGSGDKAAATDGAIAYLSAERLWQHLSNNCGKDIEALIGGLRGARFGVATDKDSHEPNPAEDIRLVAEFDSGDIGRKCKAILLVLYYVRCNLFHGRKMPASIQIDPLNHASAILRQTVVLLCSSLHAA